MPRIAFGVKPPDNGERYADRTFVPDKFRCESPGGDLKLQHRGSHDRWTASCGSESDKSNSDVAKLQSINCDAQSGGYYTVYPRGRGASAGRAPDGYETVSRWASPEEASAWLKYDGTAIPPELGEDRLYVALPEARKPGGTAPVRVDFAVARAALAPTGKFEWRVIMQPIQSTPIHNVIITVPNGITLPNDK